MLVIPSAAMNYYGQIRNPVMLITLSIAVITQTTAMSIPQCKQYMVCKAAVMTANTPASLKIIVDAVTNMRLIFQEN